MNSELNKKIRRAEFFSGLALTIVLGLAVLIGTLIFRKLWMSFKMAALLLIAVMFLMGRHRDRSMSNYMCTAFSIIAIAQAYEFYSDLTLLLDLKPDETEYFLRSAVVGMISSAVSFAAAIMCALIYMGMITIMRRRTLMIFLYAFIAACILPFSVDGGNLVSELTLLLSLCFANENFSTEKKLGKIGRLSITFFPIAVVAAAVLMAVGTLVPIVGFSDETGENMEKIAVIGTVFIASGIIALVIMVLLFPLFLLDKQFPYDMQRINSNDT